MKELLEIKRKKRKKNPDFIRSDAHKKKKLAKVWRYPKGLHNKLRLRHKGHRAVVGPGYRMPRAVRGMEISGLRKVIVNNVKDLGEINAKTECVQIADIGLKKKIEVVKEAAKKKIIIFNVKDPALFLKKAEEGLKQKEEERKKRELRKKEKGKGEAKKKEEKEEKKELSEEEKQEQERREKEKLIIKKQ